MRWMFLPQGVALLFWMFCGVLIAVTAGVAGAEGPRQRFFEFTYEAEAQNLPEGRAGWRSGCPTLSLTPLKRSGR